MKLAAADLVHQDRLGPDASFGIDDLNGLAFGREIAVSKSEQRPQHGPEIASKRGQQIFVALRPFAVAATLQHAGFDQRIEAPGQHVGRMSRLFWN